MLTFNLNIYDNVYGDASVDVVRVLVFEMLLKHVTMCLVVFMLTIGAMFQTVPGDALVVVLRIVLT